MSDIVNHPAHYNVGKIEVIDAIEAWGLGFCLGNAVKYIARAKHKGREREDLQKAYWYLARAFDNGEMSSLSHVVASFSYFEGKYPVDVVSLDWALSESLATVVRCIVRRDYQHQRAFAAMAEAMGGR